LAASESITDDGAVFRVRIFVIAHYFCEKKGKCTKGRIFIIRDKFDEDRQEKYCVDNGQG
jgi:hypothetical protein